MRQATDASIHSSNDLIEDAFSNCFLEEFKTILEGGAKEPLYVPADAGKGLNTLHYREDYLSSALHEVAHWCLAGDARRKRIDFGYWYVPEGRSVIQQTRFQSVEARPQALEWLFSLACNCDFQLSLDNHGDLGICDTEKFALSVAQEARTFVLKGLPNRAKSFFMELTRSFDTGLIPSEIDIEASLLL